MKKKIMRRICAGMMSAGLVLLPAGVAFTSATTIPVMAEELPGEFTDGEGKEYVDETLPATIQEHEEFIAHEGTLYDGDEVSQAGPVIVKQPEDVTVNYPEGCSFHVEVEDPDNVESYKWIMKDIVGKDFILEGISAQTDTLVVPSTFQNVNARRFYCVITDKDGKVTRSDMATLTEANSRESKPVLYVEEYAIEPGQTLDLSTVDIGGGRKLGSGVIEFKENATDIVISDLYFDNTYTTAGHVLAQNLGFCLTCYENDKTEYNVTLNGDNRIVNTYYDENLNLSGIPFDFYFKSRKADPLVNLKGDGKLTVTNGTNAIRAIGDLDIGIDIDVVQSSPTHYGDAIVANNIKVSEGAKLNLQANGTAINSYGNIYLQKADVTIDANVPPVGKGIATKKFINAGGDIHIDNSDLDLTFTADRDICTKTGGSGGITGNVIEIYDNSDVSVKGIVKPADTAYVSSMSGITANAKATLDHSKLVLDMDCAPAVNIQGLYAGKGGLSVTESLISADVEGNGSVYGIRTVGKLEVQDANIEVNGTHRTDYKETGGAYGILSGSAQINLTNPELEVSGSVNEGLAFACPTGDVEKTPAKYTEGYESKKVSLVDKTVCMTPENNTVNLGNIVKGDTVKEYDYVETYYDPADTQNPAKDVVISMKTDIYAVTASVAPDAKDGKVHGTIKVDKPMAKAGATVTATITPDEGYGLTDFIVTTDDKQTDLNITKTSDTTYTFTMPFAAAECTAILTENAPVIPAIEGAWANREEKTNLMFITKDSSGVYHVTIQKPVSDTESWTFEFSGTYDPELKRLGFEGAKKTINKLDANGNISKTTDENVGSGALIYKDGIFFLNIDDPEKQEEPIQFEKLSTPYEIKTKDADNGKVTTDKSTAYPGEFVIIKTEPADGFATHMVNVRDKDGKEVKVKRLGDNAFTFFMPESDVEISATFVDSGNKKYDPSGGSSTDPGYNGGSGSVTPAGTGDSNMLPLWIGIASASAAAAVTVIAIKRKRG